MSIGLVFLWVCGHNDVSIKEQCFHSMGKKGCVNNRLGLALCFRMSAQQIHIHAPTIENCIY